MSGNARAVCPQDLPLGSTEVIAYQPKKARDLAASLPKCRASFLRFTQPTISPPRRSNFWFGTDLRFSR